MKTVIEITPDDLSLFTTKTNKTIKARLALFQLKSELPILADVYTLQTKHIQAIQIDHPFREIQIYMLYNALNKNSDSFDVIFSEGFSQEEIDLMLSTMRFVE